MAGIIKNILAKSDGTTLRDHIEDCLNIFKQLRQTLPFLPEAAKLDDFWSMLFFSVFFHDFGKMHNEFQKVLHEEQNAWNHQRHEAYSIPFVDKLDLAQNSFTLIKRAILGHHRDFATLVSKIKSHEDIQLEFLTNWKRKGWEFHPEDFIENLRRSLNLDELPELLALFEKKFWEADLGALPELQSVQFSSQKHPFEEVAAPFLKEILSPKNDDYWQNLLLGAATKTCDHYASAGIKTIHMLKDSHFDFLNKLHKPYTHQQKSFKLKGNGLLIAPTGSGKTEAAMGWLRQQLTQGQGRIFYILPYTASINAMHKRLSHEFGGKEFIGLSHGKLSMYIASLFDEATHSKSKNAERNKKIRGLVGQYRKMIFPLKIVTPFQLLKYCYGVKGFDMGFVELIGAKLIFDEIHAYDEVTFAQILVSLEYFTQHLNCTVFIMTATMPTFMRNQLEKVLGKHQQIKADESLLNSLIRHRVKVLEGTIFHQMQKIQTSIESGMRVLIVCNTVGNAQEIYDSICDLELLAIDEMVLLHGRFNYLDRTQKESKVLKKDTKVLVGTQAIEVSLDADFDIIFTEPAPLDALLQRFGRVNRLASKGISDVCICSVGGEYDTRIYPEKIIERTLEKLRTLDLIKETELQDHLDFVYPDWEKDQKIKFNETIQGFRHAVESLQPYTRHKENEEEFYDKFDGIQVLPAGFWNQYKEKIQNYDFIGAEQYLVNLHRGMYGHLFQNQRIELKRVAFESFTGEDIFQNIAVVKSIYSPEKGLTQEEAEIDDFDDRNC